MRRKIDLPLLALLVVLLAGVLISCNNPPAGNNDPCSSDFDPAMAPAAVPTGGCSGACASPMTRCTRCCNRTNGGANGGTEPGYLADCRNQCGAQ